MEDLNLAYDGVPCPSNETSARVQSQVSILDTPNPLIPEIVSQNSPNRERHDAQMHPSISEPIIQELGDENRLLYIPKSIPSNRFVQLASVAASSSVHEVPSCSRTSIPLNSSLRQRKTFQDPTQISRFAETNFELPPIRSQSTSRVRFSDDLNHHQPPDEWSYRPNEYHFSNVNDTLLGVESLAHKLKIVHFSQINVDSGLPCYYRAFPERSYYVDVGKWNVKFGSVSSVNDFLQCIEELRISRGMSKNQLLRSAAELFTRDALI